MAKPKKTFVCQACGVIHPQWQGQCKSCKEWNTIVEELLEKPQKGDWQEVDQHIVNSKSKTLIKSHPLKIEEIDTHIEMRMPTLDKELNTVLGGGLVPGAVILLGGEPGIGKSTLLLQICLNLPYKTLYISGEESQKQIKMRAQRLGKVSSDECFLVTETNTQRIFKHIKQVNPDVVVIDSIQTLHSDYIESAAGSVSQIKECTTQLIRFAKQTATPVLVIGHITKEGQIAGPKLLEHMVDTVLQFEGDQNYAYRILRALKNRFGSTHELGIYEMLQTGLREVVNPSEILLSKNTQQLSGISIASTLEGGRTLMIETQALVSTAVYGTPQRSTTGYPIKRLNMLLAVLEKRVGFRLGTKDVFLNITGGITVDDPAIDLSVVAAILSSNEEVFIPKNYCFSAEVGLAGEIRPVQRIDKRIQEAEKLGFDTIVVSSYNKIEQSYSQIKLLKISKVEDLVQSLFS